MSGRAVQPPVALRIEHLVLDGAGLHARDADALRLAIESELFRLLQAGALQAGGGSVARIDAPTIALDGTSMQAHDAGARIAHSLHAAIGGSAREAGVAGRGGAR
jgi:hypothetical protein